MARLTRAPSLLGALAPQPTGLTISYEQDRVRAYPWRAWYKTRRWQALSWLVRVEEHFTCRRCQRVEGRKGQTVADHIQPHRGDPGLFWDRRNLQVLCKGCHDKVKQAEEAAERAAGRP